MLFRSKGTVRDVDQEHWEQQIGAVSAERAAKPNDQTSVAGPQIVAVLAQGRGMSDFGNVPTFDYVKDGCRVVANPLGYRSKGEQEGFRPELLIEVR